MHAYKVGKEKSSESRCMFCAEEPSQSYRCANRLARKASRGHVLSSFALSGKYGVPDGYPDVYWNLSPILLPARSRPADSVRLYQRVDMAVAKWGRRSLAKLAVHLAYDINTEITSLG
ncbi:unnamed protein product [Sphacelaria rigidula]